MDEFCHKVFVGVALFKGFLSKALNSGIKKTVEPSMITSVLDTSWLKEDAGETFDFSRLCNHEAIQLPLEIVELVGVDILLDSCTFIEWLKCLLNFMSFIGKVKHERIVLSRIGTVEA